MTSTPTGAGPDHDPSQTTQLRVPGHRNWNTGSFRRIKKTLPKYDYEHYSRLAGPLTQPDPNKPYRVQYRSLISQEPHRLRVALMLAAAPLLSVVLLVWLLQPEHWTERDYVAFDWLPALDIVMLVAIGLIELFRCLNVLSNAHATLVARDPVPVVPETGTKVAFLTSFVPGKEPLEMVTKTLEAAVRIRHRGLMHVWLLDEGDDPEVKEVCARLGVHHFSRKGVAKWNRKKGPHRAKTKHGNYNAWLDAHGDDYDFFASVDTDHVPLPNYLERMLGFFRDPDAASSSARRSTATTTTRSPSRRVAAVPLPRADPARRQPLRRADVRGHLQRGAHPGAQADRRPVRLDHRGHGDRLRDAPPQESGHRPQVALGLHPGRARGRRGPQRLDGLLHPADALVAGDVRDDPQAVLEGWYSLPPSKLFNYTMMIIFYPMSALNWILAALSCCLFLGLGASGVNIDPAVWLMLYGNASALQIGLYVWNRRHNVSPHEPEGSGGVAGMIMSALSAPLYAKALIDSVLRRKSKFVVTPKGDSASPDTLFGTFRYHWYFIVIFGGSIAAGFVYGHSHPAMIIWATFALLITASPMFAWRHELRKAKKQPPVAAAEPAPRVPPQQAPYGRHTPQHRPDWAAPADGGDDQTMQIALGGLGGRKE